MNGLLGFLFIALVISACWNCLNNFLVDDVDNGSSSNRRYDEIRRIEVFLCAVFENRYNSRAVEGLDT